jgi:hypothetical protein
MDTVEYLRHKYSGHYPNSAFPLQMAADEAHCSIMEVKEAYRRLTGRRNCPAEIRRDEFFEAVAMLI